MRQADYYTSVEQADSTEKIYVPIFDRGSLNDKSIDAGGRDANLISASFGLADNFPSAHIMCGLPAADVISLVFSHELNPDTLQAGDFRVTDKSGRKTVPACVTLRPAIALGELRTVLLMGEYGTAELESVCVVGNLLDMSRTVNFRGSSSRAVPKPVTAVVDLTFAERVPAYQEPDYPEDTPSAIRVTWQSGVTLEDGQPVPPDYASKYFITLADGTSVTPDLLGTGTSTTKTTTI
jgi:hypothetical protein